MPGGSKHLLKRLARDTLTARTEVHLKTLNQKPVRVSIADTRSRWGSCSPHNRSIRYSWRVVMAPPAVLDYLAAHEVAHLVHADHSPAYWSVVHGFGGRSPTVPRLAARTRPGAACGGALGCRDDLRSRLGGSGFNAAAPFRSPTRCPPLTPRSPPRPRTLRPEVSERSGRPGPSGLPASTAAPRTRDRSRARPARPRPYHRTSSVSLRSAIKVSRRLNWMLDDTGHLVAAQAFEQDDLVDPVQELGPEIPPSGGPS